LHTITTVAASKSFDCDRLWLNGKEFEINGRAQACLAEIRALANDRYDENTKEFLVAKSDWPKYRVHISSVNTFPTGYVNIKRFYCFENVSVLIKFCDI